MARTGWERASSPRIWAGSPPPAVGPLPAGGDGVRVGNNPRWLSVFKDPLCRPTRLRTQGGCRWPAQLAGCDAQPREVRGGAWPCLPRARCPVTRPGRGAAGAGCHGTERSGAGRIRTGVLAVLETARVDLCATAPPPGILGGLTAHLTVWAAIASHVQRSAARSNPRYAGRRTGSISVRLSYSRRAPRATRSSVSPDISSQSRSASSRSSEKMLKTSKIAVWM